MYQDRAPHLVWDYVEKLTIPKWLNRTKPKTDFVKRMEAIAAIPTQRLVFDSQKHHRFAKGKTYTRRLGPLI